MGVEGGSTPQDSRSARGELCGIMLGQMSDSSKVRARGYAIGDEAIMEDDPRKIVASHSGYTHRGFKTFSESPPLQHTTKI